MIDLGCFSHIIPMSLLAMLCKLFDGDVTGLMFTMTHASVKIQLFVDQISQLEIAMKQHFKQ